MSCLLLIMSRAKQRVRVGNTDAEGRMIMADVLCYVSFLLLIYVITKDLTLKMYILLIMWQSDKLIGQLILPSYYLNTVVQKNKNKRNARTMHRPQK